MESIWIIRVVSILLAVVGAWLVAFGLKIRSPGDMSDCEREEKSLTTTVGVTQKRAMLWWGLGLITFAGVLQITISVEYPYLLVRTHTVMLDSIGLILGIAGVVLLSLYGLPWVFVDGQRVQAPVAYQTKDGSPPGEALTKKANRFNKLSHLGIALIVLGFAFQILANIV